jgi:SpoVK/Ycf46/Vps4 family AAA+-type ATPase
MTSTNYLKKVDEAIRRRFNGHYQVGRPNPDARTKILLKKLNYFKGKDALLNHTIKITTNFTGAAMEGLANLLLKSLKIKKMNNKSQELTISEITEAAILAAGQFSIKLGVYTLPEIFSEKEGEKYLFSEAFIDKISRHFMLVKHEK